MNVRKLSVNKACIFLAVLLLAAMVTVSVALYALTQDITAVWYVLLFGIFVLFCSICFMVLVRRKLAMFSDAFCSLMDDMLSGNMQPKQTVEEESLFYKIEYRLNRLYEIRKTRTALHKSGLTCKNLFPIFLIRSRPRLRT